MDKTNAKILDESLKGKLNESTVEEEEDINVSGDLEDDLGEEDYDEEITEVDPVQDLEQESLKESTKDDSEGLLVEPASDPSIDNVDGGDGFPVIDSVDGDVSMEDIVLGEESSAEKEENKSVEPSTCKDVIESEQEDAKVVDNVDSTNVNDDVDADIETTDNVIDHDFDAELKVIYNIFLFSSFFLQKIIKNCLFLISSLFQYS